MSSLCFFHLTFWVLPVGYMTTYVLMYSAFCKECEVCHSLEQEKLKAESASTLQWPVE